MTVLAAVDAVQLSVFIALFGLITVLGFVAARWRRARLDHLDEWGLGGRNFGSWITWFLVGGDLYTAYTFVAVPALLFGVGALGFFDGKLGIDSDMTVYTGLLALIVNIAVSVVGTLIARRVKRPEGLDSTEPED